MRRKLVGAIHHDPRVVHAINDFEDAAGLAGVREDSQRIVVGFTVDSAGNGHSCVALTPTPVALSKARFEALRAAAYRASIGDASALHAWIEDNDSVVNACYRAGVKPDALFEHLRVCAEGLNCASAANR